jgi:hypothetical protein
VIVAGGAALEFLGYPEFAKVLYGIGGALGLVGLGHKMEKAKE